jgi:hypothetical protein
MACHKQTLKFLDFFNNSNGILQKPEFEGYINNPLVFKRPSFSCILGIAVNLLSILNYSTMLMVAVICQGARWVSSKCQKTFALPSARFD